MEIEEVKRVLRAAGWRETVPIRANVVDFQTSKPFYNRILLYPNQIQKLTREALEELMRTPHTSLQRIQVLKKYGLL